MTRFVSIDDVQSSPSSVRRLLSVHAHPDDESSKGAGTVRRHVDDGGEALLVTCTGGEAGEVLNESMRRPEIEENLAEVRQNELAAAADAIGFQQVVLLGYRDSGMPDTEPNAHPDAFANGDLDDEVGQLVKIIRKFQPHVMITYGDDQSHYPHPDHLRVHDISLPAFERAGDARWYPEAGSPWNVAKLYYSVWSGARVRQFHEKFLELGLRSPYDDRWLSRVGSDENVSTKIDVSGTYPARKAALIAHATQIDPESPFWFGLPDDIAAEVYPFEDYQLARSHVDIVPEETDLFAGIDEFSAER